MLTQACKRLYSVCSQNRFFVLLIAILCYLLAGPFLQPFLRFRLLISLLLTFLLLSAVYAVSEQKKIALIATALAVPWWLLQWTSHIVENPALHIATSLLQIIFLSYVIVNSIRFLARSREVDFNIVISSIVGYLLLALVWAEVYTIMEIVSPGSFNFAVIPTAAEEYRFIYFSFVTITTLGYGDILPATNLARAVSMLEAFIGQVYLVVLVAKLVGTHIAQSMKE
jgi:hypothetical protein